MARDFKLPEVSGDIREMVSYLIDVSNEVEEWKKETADVESVAVMKKDNSFVLIKPDQTVVDLRKYNITTPQQVVAYLKSQGYFVPESVEQTLEVRPRAIVPVAPVRRDRRGDITLPTLPRTLEEPERTFTEVEIYRRLLIRRWNDRWNRFTIKVLRHGKPLKRIVDGHATFFANNEADDIVDYEVNMNAVALAFLARLDISTNYDEIITFDEVEINIAPTPSATINNRFNKYSMYGDGTVTLDMAIEYLVSSLANGVFSIKNVHETPIVKIPAATFKKHFSLIEADTAWTNTVVSGNTFYNASKQIVLYDTSPSFLSFDLLGYVKATGLEESAIVFTPGQPHFVELQYSFANAEAQSVLAEYFASSSNKTIPGLLTAEFIAIVFGS